MAQAIACDICEQESAVMLETRIETGEVIGVGAACLIPFYLGAAGSLADTLDRDQAAVYGQVIADLASLPVWGLTGTLTIPNARPPEPPPVTGTEDASVSGEGISVTAETPDADHSSDGTFRYPVNHEPDRKPARQARNRARTPK